METTTQCDSLIPNSQIFEPEVLECLETPVNANGDGDNSRTVEEVTTSSKPFVGMEFDSLHQAFLFYNEYAAIVGFSVRKDKTRKSNIDGSYLFRRFCCSKEGYPRKNRENPVKEEIRIIQLVGRSGRRVKLEMQRQAEVLQKMRVGCNAKIDVKRTSDGKWLVQKFVEEHNHECVSLGETHLLRSHRERQLDSSCGNVDNQGVGEHSSSDELVTRNDLSCIKPSVGMEFESHHKAFLFYNAYARFLGFTVRKDKTRKSNIDGSLLFRRFCCSKEGYRRKNCENDIDDRRKDVGGITVKTRPRNLPVTRVGCNAKCEVKKTDGKWVVQKFIEEHNHEFDRLGEMQVVKPIGGKLNEALITEGMEPKKVVHSSTWEACGGEKDGHFEPRLKIKINKKRRKKLEKGDIHAFLNYFRQMQTENPSFFYAIEVDEEDQMVSCFWADARSRMDFGYFGDVICIETNYGTSKYGRPFTPILGVNHHLQTVLFGCAILLHETEESFIWLLQTFSKAMHQHHPVTIITNPDEIMAGAIEQVLPGTHHLVPLRHIFENSAKNLSHVYNNEEMFSTDFKRCIYDPQLCDEFESRWAALVDKYDLRDREWLRSIYEKRQKWVPVYLKHVFHANMATTQRSESIDSFFNGYLSKSLSPDEFVNQYEKALVDSREKENCADFVSHQTRHVLKSDLPMEKQAADIYTKSMFEEFHKEFCDSFNYVAVESESLETYRKFMVSRISQWGGNSNCLVKFNYRNNDIRVTCSCQSFESMGVLCRHILKVFTETNTVLIPEVYLMKRWTKRAKWGVVLRESNVETQAQNQNILAFRYTDLWHLAVNLSAKGAISTKAYLIAMSNIEMNLRELKKAGEEDTCITQPDIQGIQSLCSPIEVVKNNGSSKHFASEGNGNLPTTSNIAISDPPHIRPKERPPKRIISSLADPGNKKARPEPAATVHNTAPSNSRTMGLEPNDPSHAGGTSRETQNHSGLLNICSNICVYPCTPPGTSSDINEHYHTSDTPSFGEPFAGLSCIQTSEPNIFDLNQVGFWN